MTGQIYVDEATHGYRDPERNIIAAVTSWYLANPDDELPPVLYPAATGHIEIPAIDIFDCYAAYHKLPPVPVIDASRDDRDRRRQLYGSAYR